MQHLITRTEIRFMMTTIGPKHLGEWGYSKDI